MEQLAIDLHESQYGDRVAVYTDGSVKEGKSTYAAWSKDFKLVSRFRNRASVFSAELKAIINEASVFSAELKAELKANFHCKIHWDLCNIF